MSSGDAPTALNYIVKNVEEILSGAHARARVFTLATGQSIPWHHHSEVTDHYFVLGGSLTIKTRNPDEEHQLQIGERHQVRPGTAHLVSNGGPMDCRFLLLQGGGSYDWIKLQD